MAELLSVRRRFLVGGGLTASVKIYMGNITQIETPDESWYSRQSTKKQLPAHCPISTCDKCPRYYLSLKLVDSMLPGTLSLPSEERLFLEEKWKFSDAFANDDLSVGIYPSEKGGFKSVDGFCPEVTATYLGLYCSSLHAFADDDHRYWAQSALKSARIPQTDPQWHWGLIVPLHFSNCKEFSVYAAHQSPNSANSKKKGNISARMRWKVLERDNFTCQYCGVRGGENAQLQIDHRVSLADGGTDGLENLITSCAKCNGGKGARSVEL